MASQPKDKDTTTHAGTSSTAVELEEPAHDILTIPDPLVNPPERTKTSLSYRALRQLCVQFGISEEEVRLPGEVDFADSPPH